MYKPQPKLSSQSDRPFRECFAVAVWLIYQQNRKPTLTAVSKTVDYWMPLTLQDLQVLNGFPWLHCFGLQKLQSLLALPCGQRPGSQRKIVMSQQKHLLFDRSEGRGCGCTTALSEIHCYLEPFVLSNIANLTVQWQYTKPAHTDHHLNRYQSSGRNHNRSSMLW